MSDPRKVRIMLVKKAIQESGLTRAQIARDSGLSEATVWAWEAERRVPSPESLARLAAGLRSRGDELHRLAEALESA